MVGEKGEGTFGSLPVRGGSGLVDCCLPLVTADVAAPCRSCSLVHAGGTVMRLGRIAERFRAGGQHFCGGNVRLDRMAPGRFHPLARGGGPAPHGLPVSFSERVEPRADGVEPSVNLPPALRRGHRLTVHAS